MICYPEKKTILDEQDFSKFIIRKECFSEGERFKPLKEKTGTRVVRKVIASKHQYRVEISLAKNDSEI